MSKTTKISARFIIAYDEKRDSHRILENGQVVFAGDSIVYTGFDYPGAVDQHIEAGNSVVGPGFIDLDALADLDSTILGFDNQPDWATGRVWDSGFLDAGPRDVYSAEEEAFKTHYSIVQLLLNGVTTMLPITSLGYRKWGETIDEFRRVAQLVETLGIRAYLGPAYRSGLSIVCPDGAIEMRFDEAKGLAGLDDAVRYAGEVDGSAQGRIHAMLAPDRIEGCTQTLLERTAAAARDLDCPLRLHCCQSLKEVELVKASFGKAPLQLLEQTGLLNPRAILPHGIYLSNHSSAKNQNSGDISRLIDSGSNIVHCPTVMARLGRPMESFARLKRVGINIGLGTDTFPPDVIGNMRDGINMCRIVEQDPSACSAADFYEAATLGGARALGRSDLGRLAPGAKADITIFDLSGFHLGQFIDPIQTMVLAGSGRDIRTVIVNGALIVQDREIPGIDFDVFHQRAQQQFDKLRRSHPERAFRHPPIESIFKPSYPLQRQ